MYDRHTELVPSSAHLLRLTLVLGSQETGKHREEHVTPQSPDSLCALSSEAKLGRTSRWSPAAGKGGRKAALSPLQSHLSPTCRGRPAGSHTGSDPRQQDPRQKPAQVEDSVHVVTPSALVSRWGRKTERQEGRALFVVSCCGHPRELGVGGGCNIDKQSPMLQMPNWINLMENRVFPPL